MTINSATKLYHNSIIEKVHLMCKLGHEYKKKKIYDRIFCESKNMCFIATKSFSVFIVLEREFRNIFWFPDMLVADILD